MRPLRLNCRFLYNFTGSVFKVDASKRLAAGVVLLAQALLAQTTTPPVTIEPDSSGLDSALIAADSSPPSAYKEALIQLSISQLAASRFDRVFFLARKLKQRYPADPAGYLIEANALQTIMRDYRVRLYEQRFETEIQDALDLARERLKQDRSAVNHFVLGSAEGYLSLHHYREGKWLSAIRGVVNSMRNLSTAHSRDPDFVDPLLGLALYEYGKDRVPLLKGNLTKAVNYLQTVRQGGRYVAVDALFSLQLIYFYMGKYDLAFDINEQLFENYGGNPVCLYNRGLLLEERGQPAEATVVWQSLIDHLQNFARPSDGFLAECYLHLSNVYRLLDQSERARAALSQADHHVRQYRADEELDGPYETFEETRKAVRKMAGALQAAQ